MKSLPYLDVKPTFESASGNVHQQLCTFKSVNVDTLNPLSNNRWDELVSRHPGASAFHQRGWLEALARTYGYEPLVLTTAVNNEPLSDGIVLCKVSSAITGTRLVSVPFADHCEPLLNKTGDIQPFLDALRANFSTGRWKYIELRSLSAVQDAQCSLQPSQSFWYHQLDTRPSLDELAEGLHGNSFRRKITKAKKEKLSYEIGCSKQQLNEFYQLLIATRRRHGILPQPRSWFENLVDCMGDQIRIRLVRKDRTPIAAMLTLRHRSTILYKYGCSDARFHSLGAMPFLFWKLIEESKASGADKIDLGRTDLDNQGLIVFKDRLGATRTLLKYYRYENRKNSALASYRQWHSMRRVFSVLPNAALSAAGGLVYRHIG